MLHTGKAPANPDAFNWGEVSIRTYTVNADKILDIVQKVGSKGNYKLSDLFIDSERN